MKIDESNSSIEFNNVFRATVSVNDVKGETVKVNSYSFTNTNSKGDFKPVRNVEDLNGLHELGLKSAKRTFAIMNAE
ncbi:MAG: hypothetical protein A6F71_02460 [Cycloclasticus sp. symbiont of Poecilosclerida sp. M]|nr:MAG: hypothetical protein A6F71_02460 [Cycloclasticus sp. symbiont of Poecilosclerida sp. M]